MINRIIFAAGGTGGHIYPAIAIADELKKLNENTEILFIGAKGRIEEKIVPENGYELETINVTGIKRSINFKNIAALFKLLNALKESKQLLRKFSPELVYGTGGFLSGPVIKAAQSMGITNVVEEGNYYPGVTVKLVASKADKVIVNFEGTKQFLKRTDNVSVMSYPVRQNLRRYEKKEAAEFFGLDGDKKILFVFGGSQGAGSINSAILKCFKKLITSDIQIIWQTGINDFEAVNSEVSAIKDIKVLKYIDKIDLAYSSSDLVVCRSGISTIMELAVFGMAVIFVPYPKASEDHQYKNAKAVAEKNAAGLIADSDLDEKLEPEILSLINDNSKLDNMRLNIKKMADREAASKIAKMLEEMLNKSKN